MLLFPTDGVQYTLSHSHLRLFGKLAILDLTTNTHDDTHVFPKAREITADQLRNTKKCSVRSSPNTSKYNEPLTQPK